MNMREENNGRRRAPRLLRRMVLIVTLAVALTLADALSPYVKSWMSHILPGIDYQTASVLLAHQMEKAGELIAVRYTDTKVMEGKKEILGAYTAIGVKAPYRYEIGLGIKLEDVKLEIGEGELVVIVPNPQVLYDYFQVSGEIQKHDFWNLLSEQMFQEMQDEQHVACRQSYLDDPEYMEKAWEASCEQLEALFRQWTGENLQLRFLREGE